MPINSRLGRAARLVASGLVLLIPFALGACGGDDDDATPTNAVSTAVTTSATATSSPAAQAFPVEFRDSTGTLVTFASAPKRILSYSPGATEILFAIGAGDQVIGTDKFSDFPDKAKALPKLEYSKPAPEPAVALTPDLVVMATRQEGQVAAFRALNLKVVLLKEPEDLASVATQVEQLGRITGHSEQATKVAGDMRKRMDAMTAKVAKTANGPKVFYELSADGFTVAPNSFVGSMLKMLKAGNVAEGATTAFPQLSAEAIIAGNPDVIILADGGDRGGQSADTVKARPGWSGIAAVKFGRIHIINSDLYNRPGPRVIDALEELVKILYPGQ